MVKLGETKGDRRMRLFSYENLARSKWNSEIINLLSQIHEYIGK